MFRKVERFVKRVCLVTRAFSGGHAKVMSTHLNNVQLNRDVHRAPCRVEQQTVLDGHDAIVGSVHEKRRRSFVGELHFVNQRMNHAFRGRFAE